MKILKIDLSSNHSFILFRYFLYFFIGLEVILVPLILEDKGVYANGEYFKSIISLMPLFLMGVHSGFFRTVFIDKVDLRHSLVVGGTVLLVPIALFCSVYFSNLFLFFAILIFGLSIFLEKIYQLKKMFNWALLFKPLFSIFYILICFVFFKANVNIINLLAIAYILSITIYIIPYLNDEGIKVVFSQLLNDIVRLIKNGFWINLGTLSIGALLLLDRHMLKISNIEALADYSFAYNVCSFLFAYFTSLTFINEIHYGETINEFSILTLKESLHKIIKHFIFGFIITLFLYLILGYFIPKYSSGIYMFLIISICWGVFYSLGTFGPLVQYFNLQRHLAIVTILITTITLISYAYLIFYEIKFNPYYLVLKTGLSILLYSLYQLKVIYVKIVDNG